MVSSEFPPIIGTSNFGRWFFSPDSYKWSTYVLRMENETEDFWWLPKLSRFLLSFKSQIQNKTYLHDAAKNMYEIIYLHNFTYEKSWAG